MFTRRRANPLVGLGFGIYVLLALCIFLLMWPLSGLRPAVLVASYVALFGIAAMMLGYLRSQEFTKYVGAFATQVTFPMVGLVYAYGHGFSWLWTYGWLVFGLGLVQNLLKLRRPDLFSIEGARQLFDPYYDIPVAIRFMMSVLRWSTTVGLGIFLIAANLGHSGGLVILSLGVAIAAGLPNILLTLRYRREQLPQQ